MGELSHGVTISTVRLEYKSCTSADELKENKTRRFNKLVLISSFYIIHAIALD